MKLSHERKVRSLAKKTLGSCKGAREVISSLDLICCTTAPPQPSAGPPSLERDHQTTRHGSRLFYALPESMYLRHGLGERCACCWGAGGEERQTCKRVPRSAFPLVDLLKSSAEPIQNAPEETRVTYMGAEV